MLRYKQNMTAIRQGIKIWMMNISMRLMKKIPCRPASVNGDQSTTVKIRAYADFEAKYSNLKEDYDIYIKSANEKEDAIYKELKALESHHAKLKTEHGLALKKLEEKPKEIEVVKEVPVEVDKRSRKDRGGTRRSS